MRILILFLFINVIVFSQDISLDSAVYNAFQYCTITADFHTSNPNDSLFIPFMDDSIKVNIEDYWGFTELILIEIEYKGYRFLERIQKSKFLKLPPYIFHQIYRILKKKYKN